MLVGNRGQPGNERFAVCREHYGMGTAIRVMLATDEQAFFGQAIRKLA